MAYYTYLHRDRAGRVFYIGCASICQNKRGTRAKYQRAYSKSGHSEGWRAVATEGYAVEILQRFTDRWAAFAEEVRLIADHRTQGSPLVNIARGGPGMPGVKDSEAARRKKSITKIGVLNPMYGKTGAAHPNSRRVVDRTTGTTYDSVQIAADARGHKMKTLYNWLSGHRPNPTALEFL